MNKILLFTLIISLSFIITASKWKGDEVNANSQISKRVDDLISQMTLEEKVGQMTQIIKMKNS